MNSQFLKFSLLDDPIDRRDYPLNRHAQNAFGLFKLATKNSRDTVDKGASSKTTRSAWSSRAASDFGLTSRK